MSAEQTEASPVLDTAIESPSLLDSIIDQSRVAITDQEKTHTRDLIGELVNQVLEGSVTISRDLTASMDARIAEIDALISDQLNEVMHHPEFQKLEASWRGLKYLIMQVQGAVSNQGRIDANQLSLTADQVDNQGMISGAQVSLKARTLDNHDATAVLAATGSLGIETSERLSNTNGAYIYSGGSLNLKSDGLLDNVSSNIEASGDLTVAANQINNRRTIIDIQREAETTSYDWYRYSYYWRSFGTGSSGDLSAVTQILPFNDPTAANSRYGTILQLDEANKRAMVRFQGNHELWVNYNSIKKTPSGSYSMTFYEGKHCPGKGEACPYQQIVWREYTGSQSIEQWDPAIHTNPLELNDIEDIYNFRERTAHVYS